MDPFNKLPAELRAEIIVSTRCPRTVLQLIQASPVMLRQYTASKGYITRAMVASDFDDDMVQDALAIVLFPSRSSGDFATLVHFHCRAWATRQLADPFRRPFHNSQDRDLIDKMSALYRTLMFFIGDYLTKATACFPPREYLCLSTPAEPRLRFKGQAVSARFNAALLAQAERKGLLRAFMRYQLASLIGQSVDEDIYDSLRDDALFQYNGRWFRQWELHAILCVDQYLRCLYGAMFAHCGDSRLPDPATDSASSRPPGLLYPDNQYHDPNAYAHDMGCSHYWIASALAPHGFDLVATLLRSATAGPPARDRLRKWFVDYNPKGCFKSRVFDYISCVHDYLDEGNYYIDEDHYYLDEGRANDDLGEAYENDKKGPGMYQALYRRLKKTKTLDDIYQQRAWPFLNNTRFYPDESPGGGSYFPDEGEAWDMNHRNHKLDEGWHNVIQWGARARYRGQRRHNEQCETSSEKMEVGDPQDSELEKECQVSLPDMVDGRPFPILRPFWQWDESSA
ncbi:hypothetical protein LX36DRAFT_664684 [Colletotrichum falcatum]|nr:hypothetical protein LX36DRAFT_664684 [Colletotrichum falcatum]